MTPLFKKLNYKGQNEIYIVNFPQEFISEVEAMKKVTLIKTDIHRSEKLEFLLAFVTAKAEIDKIAAVIEKKLKDDGIIWFAYPKGTSKKYKAAINRDNGWDMLGKIGLEGVRAVAIDNDWSALRFRKVDYIKLMTRSEKMAMTTKGKSRTKSWNKEG